MSENAQPQAYPHLCTLLRDMGMPMKARFTIEETMSLFSTSRTTLRNWDDSGELPLRTIPGGKWYWPEDLERVLVNSIKRRIPKAKRPRRHKGS